MSEALIKKDSNEPYWHLVDEPYDYGTVTGVGA